LAVCRVKDLPAGTIRELLDHDETLADRIDSATPEEEILLGPARVVSRTSGCLLVEGYVCRAMPIRELADHIRASLATSAEKLERQLEAKAAAEKAVAISAEAEKVRREVEEARRRAEAEKDEAERMMNPLWASKRLAERVRDLEALAAKFLGK
jgi:hypothetical protein